MLILAAFSRHEAALQWAAARAIETWGPAALESPAFEFNETAYYQAAMGPGLRKRFWGFARLVDPGGAARNQAPDQSLGGGICRGRRISRAAALNLDPGYLTLAKLVLASTKDFAHRIYLGRGIYAEVTLFYKHRRWQHHEYTFADYRREDYQRFFSACRDWLRRQSGRKAASGGGASHARPHC